MSTVSAGQWVKFFNVAGIPSSAAATYAHIFVENRIQTDMLLDLNKEYLREMGISPMGDIIAILRHAKEVYEQTARDKVLSSEIKVPVATVTANVSSNKKPVATAVRVPSTVSRSRQQKSPSPISLDYDGMNMKPPRRVLPEHEGRYKITLPSGTTQRSKEILAKKAILYSDREGKRVDVFDRLRMGREASGSAEKPEQLVRIIGLDKQATSTSIFSRLGGISDKPERKIGILKNSPIKPHGGVTKKIIKNNQQVILVKKIPAKAATMVADDYDVPERMETGEKMVSFSSEDEILEIAPRRVILKPKSTEQGVKARLGMNASRSLDGLHKTRKVVKLKPTVVKRSSPIKLSQQLAARMKSDEILRQKSSSIHSRLDLSSKRPAAVKSAPPSVSRLANRIGKVNLATVRKRPDQQSTSVFERLGRF